MVPERRTPPLPHDPEAAARLRSRFAELSEDARRFAGSAEGERGEAEQGHDQQREQPGAQAVQDGAAAAGGRLTWGAAHASAPPP